MSKDMGQEEGAADSDFKIPLNMQQLRAFQHGIGARIMPSHQGWKIDINDRFAVPPAQEGSAYRLPPDDLDWT